jgi:UDP-GlcNAc:undecaprenyl-phosphate/decaprenyl-phosphate GlcNAc-1-phosphate transferase
LITFTVAFAIAFGLAVVLTPVVREVALRLGLVDSRSSRKLHTGPIPRLGGVAIVVAFYAPLVGLLLVNSGIGAVFKAQIWQVVGLFAGGAIIAVLGLYDDLRGANAYQKFTVQFGVALGMYLLGFRIDAITLPFAPTISLGWFAMPFTMLWIVGIVNALNLIDGLDGLASGVAFFAVLTNFILAFMRGDLVTALCMAALGGGVIGFLVYNFNPASIFMGDTGSMFLGFVIAALSISTNSKTTATVALATPVVALGLPIADTLFAMIRRAIRGLPMFTADREHIHHRLLAAGFTHRQAVLLLYGACCVFALAALINAAANGLQSAVLLVVLLIVVAALARRLGYLRLAVDFLAKRKRNLALRDRVKRAAATLRSARSAREVWDAVRDFGRALGASRFALRLSSAEGETFEWTPESPPRALTSFQATFPLSADGRDLGAIDVRWHDGRQSMPREEEIAVEMLCDHLKAASLRLAPAGENVIHLSRARSG